MNRENKNIDELEYMEYMRKGILSTRMKMMLLIFVKGKMNYSGNISAGDS